jgi:hypothetical protein
VRELLLSGYGGGLVAEIELRFVFVDGFLGVGGGI